MEKQHDLTQAEQQEVCWQCGGTGEADTGGVMPWGAPAMATCPCQRESQAEQQEARGAQVVDGLPRSLRSVIGMVLNALDRDAADGKPARGEMASELRAALATQPATIKLPERKKYNGLGSTAENLTSAAWNECLDAVEKLNAVRGAEHE